MFGQALGAVGTFAMQGGFGGNNNNNVTPNTGTIGDTTTGKIGSAFDFGGANQAARQAYRGMTQDQLNQLSVAAGFDPNKSIRRQFIDSYTQGGNFSGLYQTIMNQQ
jgi:hypothetical protein